MITADQLMILKENDIQNISKVINKNDISQFVEWLSEKNDKVRYNSLLLLENYSAYFKDVYFFWDVFIEKLRNKNSYQRIIGLKLIADNVKWDEDNKFEKIFDEYFNFLNDDKLIIIRQGLQSIQNIIPYKEHLNNRIANKIMSLNIWNLRETMRKPILMDILNALILIKKNQANDEIDNYIINAVSGGVLDKKTKKQIASDLQLPLIF
ncbi:hypothetical protein CDLVIII_3298 [Clostridium sp. DL-VIII]|uniref:hypothetical protein n=1 Tax=Clostridium sp. DL-VIII TaxID=641107 RepID=UPI00023B0189|nr:hypothetical protein [Clostridium sp. DL-VIII]EHI99870.1 hypothetical protein CDLVIII_3298 [Clostridium sp. DL-VIII]